MKTLKTMILSAGAVVLLGASYAPQTVAAVQNAARPAGDSAASATTTSHDPMSIGNAEAGNNDAQPLAPAGNQNPLGLSLPGNAGRRKAPVLVAPVCPLGCSLPLPTFNGPFLGSATAAVRSKWELFRLTVRAMLG